LPYKIICPVLLGSVDVQWFWRAHATVPLEVYSVLCDPLKSID